MVFVVEGSGGKPEMVPQMTREGQKLKNGLNGKKVGEEDKLLQFPIVFSHRLTTSLSTKCVVFQLAGGGNEFHLPIIMTSAKRQEAVAMLRRRRRRGRTRK
jgi:hypothetical protein